MINPLFSHLRSGVGILGHDRVLVGAFPENHYFIKYCLIKASFSAKTANTELIVPFALGSQARGKFDTS
ncbi:hypothetical protein AF72_03120 [Xylella taiwanensis]|uniref:Uncharacterized protein n=1 Tax=Xylella taiwanensis TaxID=1444770 RepID=Z9JL55_9GAMM|nr:hypothetical protein AF72_03120 [Xylella taiwanensis]